jgi:hypothetical protein
VVVIAGIVGVLVGFGIGLLMGEVILSEQGDWTNVLPWVLAVAGWLVGAGAARHLKGNATPS